MSMRDLPKEYLVKELKKFGIELTPETRWEVRGKELIIYLENRIPLKIKDPQIVIAAKAVIDEEIFKQLYTLDNLIKRIYALRFTYEGVRVPFSEFKKKYEGKDKEEVINELKRLEEEYIKERNLTFEELGEDMLAALTAHSIYKSSSIPVGLSYKDLPYTTQELTEIIARVSEKEKFSLAEELRLY